MSSLDTSKRVWKVLKRAAINEAGELWFPQRLSREFLDQQKQSIGPYLFASQYLLTHIAPEDRRFLPEWLQYFQGYLVRSEGYHSLVIEKTQGAPRFLDRGRLLPVNVSTSIDPAITDDRKSDYTGIVTNAVDPLGRWYILSARRFRGGANEVIDQVIEEIKKYAPHIVGIESVAFQKALKEFLVSRLRDEGIITSIQELTSTVGRGKRARIEGLVPKFANREVFLNNTLGPELERELLSWSPKRELPHDDVIDALSFQLDIAIPAASGGQRAPSGEWYDLHPEERRRIRERKAAREHEHTSSGIRTGY